MMNRKNILYFLLVGAVIALLMGGREKPLNWLETYEFDDKNPYGTYVLNELLPEFNGNHDIEILDEPFINNEVKLRFSRNTSLVLISKQIDFSLKDIELLNEFMEQGNTVFLSAEAFNTRFTSEYDLEIGTGINWNNDTTLIQQFVNEKYIKDTINLGNWNLSSYFELDTNFQGSTLAILANDSRPNYIRIKRGKGQLLVHLNPRSFGNINLLKDSKAAAYTLSFLPKQDILWDQYHQSYSRTKKDQLSYISSNQSLRYAYNLGILSILLFALFRSKRIQRIIPVIKRPKNESLEFIETIGRLYYDEGKHRNLAEKKINHFYLYTREKYRLNKESEDYWQKLQAKSGYNETDFLKLKEMLQAFPTLKGISEAFLLRLNNHIDQFYERTGKQYFYE